MAIVLVLLGCVIFYLKSKHAPVYNARPLVLLKDNPWLARLIAYGLFFVALYIICLNHGFFTGLSIFLMVLMLGLGLCIVLLPLNNRYAFVLVGLSLLSVLLENML